MSSKKRIYQVAKEYNISNEALIDFLKASDLVIAHQEISQQKLWIKKENGNFDY